jgi:hypothetical protein
VEETVTATRESWLRAPVVIIFAPNEITQKRMPYYNATQCRQLKSIKVGRAGLAARMG